MIMLDVNFKIKGDLIGLSSEVTSLTNEMVTLDDGSERTYSNGTTFLAVDTRDLYILYNHKWYKL